MRLSDAHVCHVTTAHTPDDIRIYWRECVQIRERVGDVTLVAPTDRAKLTTEGIRIIPYRTARPWGWGTRMLAGQRAAAVAFQQLADLYHFHEPELLVPMACLSQRTGKPIVFDVHEFYKATIRGRRGWKGKIAELTYTMLENYALRYTSAVVSVTPQIVSMYEGRVPHVALVRNFADADAIFRLVPSLLEPIPGRLLFSGSLEQRSLLLLAEAFRQLVLEFPSLHLHLAGDFDTEAFKKQVESHWGECGVRDRLHMLGRLSREDLLKHASTCMVGLVLFWPSENARVGLPNKLFEYMAVGLPVVVPDLPNHRQIVEETRCGIWCDTSDSQSIAEALRILLRNPEAMELMRKRGREACKERYQMKAEAESLISIYQRVLNDSGESASRRRL